MAVSGHMTKKGWNVLAEEPETNTEVLRNEKARNNSKRELVQNRLSDGAIVNAYDTHIITCPETRERLVAYQKFSR